MPDKLTLALIGCGGMMGAHVEGYRELYNAGLKDFEIIACCDVDGAKAASMADSIAGFQGRNPPFSIPSKPFWRAKPAS